MDKSGLARSGGSCDEDWGSALLDGKANPVEFFGYFNVRRRWVAIGRIDRCGFVDCRASALGWVLEICRSGAAAFWSRFFAQEKFPSEDQEHRG